MVLDSLLLGVPTAILGVIASNTFGTSRLELTTTGIRTVHQLTGLRLFIVFVVLTIPAALYFAYFNGKRGGQTPGNRAPGIAVRDSRTGEVIGLKRGLLRWFVRFVLYLAFGIPGLLNDLSPLWDSRRQSFADKLARSIVVHLS